MFSRNSWVLLGRVPKAGRCGVVMLRLYGVLTHCQSYQKIQYEFHDDTSLPSLRRFED